MRSSSPALHDGEVRTAIRSARGVGQAAPAVGTYLASPTGVTVLLLTRVARIVGGQGGWRIYALRLRKAMLPEGVAVLPWPKARKVPSRAAEPPAPTERPPIVTRQQKQQAERKRITQHRGAALEADNQVIEPVRRANGTAVAGVWRDPDDVGKAAVLRRAAKEVKGFRGDDPIQRLQDNDTITRAQARAVRRLRRDWEIGAQLQHGSVDWERASSSPSGSTPTGFAEHVLQYLERFQQAKAALGRLFEIVECVCLNGVTVGDYAAHRRINRMSASGRLYSALQALEDWYDKLEPEPKARDIATINTGQYKRPLEPSQPAAASRWAAD